MAGGSDAPSRLSKQFALKSTAWPRDGRDMAAKLARQSRVDVRLRTGGVNHWGIKPDRI
jgi:hypothetical protein